MFRLSITRKLGNNDKRTKDYRQLYLFQGIKLDKKIPVKNVGEIHILFVDDDSNLLQAAKRLLKRKDYIVTSASSSSEAIALIKEYNDVFDVIITDYSMPDMNGVELALAASRILAGTPVILLTGSIDPIDEKKVKEAGIAGVVNKPCKMEELDSAIKKVINKNDMQFF